jgi:hypothetical protein
MAGRAGWTAHLRWCTVDPSELGAGGRGGPLRGGGRSTTRRQHDGRRRVGRRGIRRRSTCRSARCSGVVRALGRPGVCQADRGITLPKHFSSAAGESRAALPHSSRGGSASERRHRGSVPGARAVGCLPRLPVGRARGTQANASEPAARVRRDCRHAGGGRGSRPQICRDKRLSMEPDILKKAAAFFANDSETP